MGENTIRLILLFVGAAIILGILWDGLRRKKRRLLNTNEQEAIRQSFEENDDELDEEREEEEEEPIAEDDDEDEEQEYDDDIDVEPLEDFEEEDACEDKGEEVEEWPDESVDEELVMKSSNKPDFISIRLMAKSGQFFGGYHLLQFLLANRLDYGDMKLFHRFADENKKVKLFSLASLNEPGDFELSKMNAFECEGLILYMHPAEHQDPLSVFDMMLETAYDLAHDLRGELMSGKNQAWNNETTEEIRETLS